MILAESAAEPPETSPSASADAAASTLDRVITPISGRLGGGLTSKVVTLAALAAGCGAFVLATGHHAAPKTKAVEEPASQVVPFEPAKPSVPTLANPGSNAPSLDPKGGSDSGSGAAAATPPGAGSAETAAQAAQQRANELQAIRAAPMLAFNHSEGGAAASSPNEGGLSAALPAHAPTELDQMRQGSAITLAHASRLPDRRFLIAAGAAIPCTLQTAMDTATPGYVSCLIGQDVYSDDGSVILMEKGSKVLGEYRSGMRQGQNRLFVLWSRAVTPGGVAIGLASPATDALGRAGFDGAVDTHFWDRFGGALMLSIIDDGSAAIASKADTTGETVRVPSDAAAVALQNSVNIAPSLRKVQGSSVAIFVAQDLDFSTVYALKAR